jgi:hypothetical protein
VAISGFSGAVGDGGFADASVVFDIRGILFNRHPYCCACPTGKPIQRAAGCVSQLCKHKQYIDKYGEDMPEIRNWQWSTPNTSLLVTALVLLKFAVIRTRNQDEDYPSGAG